MGKIIIREATKDFEIEEVFNIRKEVFVDEQGMFRDTDKDENDRKSIYLIAQHNDVIIGTVRVYPVEGGDWVGGRLAVRKEYRGGKAGYLLVKEAVKLVKKKKCKRFTAAIQARNVNFFKRLGWKPIGNVQNYRGVPHQKMEADLTGTEKEE